MRRKHASILTSRSAILLGGLLLLALATVVFVYIEVTQSRDELLDLVYSEASSVIETLNRSGETTIRANSELEAAIMDRLIVSAKLIDNLSEHLTDGSVPLPKKAEELELALALIVDDNGRITASSLPGEKRKHDAAHAPALQALIDPVLDDTFTWTADAGVHCVCTGDTLFVVAHERRSRSGAVIVGLLSADLRAIRKRLGIGKLVQDIGRNEGIAYVVLQDSDGILTASEGVEGMSSVSDDTLLLQALAGDSVYTRISMYRGENVYEAVSALRISSEQPVLSRVALSLKHVESIQQRSMRRVILIALGFFVTAAILFVLQLLRKRYSRLEAEHEQVRSYQELVLDGIADAVVAVSATGRITLANRSAETILGKSIDELYDARYEELFARDPLLLKHTFDTQSTVTYEETTMEGDDGDSRYLAVSTSFVHSREGDVHSIVAIARDITAQRHAQEQLERQGRLTAMGELAGGIAHEIRNPLNAINIIAQRFQTEFQAREDEEEFKQLNRTIRSEVERVNNIIRQFLDFARPPQLLLERANMAVLLQKSIDVIHSQAKQKNVTLTLLIEDDLPVRADHEKIHQVLLNLLQNALDAVKPGGEIKCIACRRDQMVFVSIADNGTGIPEELQSKIFNLYFTTKSEGTGLGLSIVHQIISEHRGEISVTSTEGSGTTISIRIPTR